VLAVPMRGSRTRLQPPRGSTEHGCLSPQTVLVSSEALKAISVVNIAVALTVVDERKRLSG
jgi:hypothetical protein